LNGVKLTPRVKYVSKYKGNRRVKRAFIPQGCRQVRTCWLMNV